MTKVVRFEPSAHLCPSCGKRFTIAGGVNMTPTSLGMEFACEHCSARVSVRVDRRGRLRLTLEPLKSLRALDGSSLRAVWSGPGDGRSRLVYEVGRRPTGELGIGWAMKRAPREVRLPVVWTPDSPGADSVPLTPGAGKLLRVVCRCPACDSRLTELRWLAGLTVRDGPPPGVVVIDTLLKDRGLPQALLDQRLRDLDYAAALLVCRRRGCKAETAFIFRQPRSLRRISLADLLALCDNEVRDTEPKPGGDC